MPTGLAATTARAVESLLLMLLLWRGTVLQDSVCRVASNRNHVRRADSSTRLPWLAAATLSRSQSKRLAHVCCELFVVVAKSASICIAATKSESLSRMRRKQLMWPIERTAVPPVDLADTLSYNVGSGEDLV
jgi:hypothetical protein